MRRAWTPLLAALEQFPAVALLGPRQVGKTTLADLVGRRRASLYLDLESPKDRAKLAEPELFLRMHQDRLIILDEVQRAPEIFQVLRGLIDQARRQGRGAGQFLLLGSASMDLLQQSGESLAGRIAYLELAPLNLLEVAGQQADRHGQTSQDRLWLRGGFPDSFLAASDAASVMWRTNFIRTYLERDIPQFEPRIAGETLRRFWTMLAHGQATLLNAAGLGRSLGVDGRAIARYLDLLVDLLLVRRLPPFHINIAKRLVKSPKLYLRDSGLLHSLLGIDSLVELHGHPVMGGSWEGFVLENLISAAPDRTTAYFYRTAAGAEIDLILQHSSGELWAIEVKRSLAPQLTKGFYQACEDLRPARRYVVYAGEDRYSRKACEFVSLRQLMTDLAQLSAATEPEVALAPARDFQ